MLWGLVGRTGRVCLCTHWAVTRAPGGRTRPELPGGGCAFTSWNLPDCPRRCPLWFLVTEKYTWCSGNLLPGLQLQFCVEFVQLFESSIPFWYHFCLIFVIVMVEPSFYLAVQTSLCWHLDSSFYLFLTHKWIIFSTVVQGSTFILLFDLMLKKFLSFKYFVKIITFLIFLLGGKKPETLLIQCPSAGLTKAKVCPLSWGCISVHLVSFVSLKTGKTE